jgi:hypothetical protein
MSKDGCWVQFYDGKDETQGTLRFDGPKDVADLNDYQFSTGEKGGNEPDSMVTGSRAWIQVYKDTNYGGKTAYFYPNQKIDSLSDYDLGGKIDSFKLYDSQPAFFPQPTTVTWAIEDNEGVVSSSTVNNLLRTTLGSALMLVPEVGSAMKTMLYGLWPEQKVSQEQAWASLQNYMSQVIGTIYNQIAVASLNNKLQGLYNVTRDYVDAPAERRGSAFGGLLTDLRQMEPSFINVESPQTYLSFFIPFGSLMLLTLREQIIFYTDIYGAPAAPEERQKLIGELQDKILQYQTSINKARSDLLIKRPTMLKLIDESSVTTHMWTSIDTYSGWRGTTFIGTAAKTNAKYEADQRAESATNALAWHLDQNIAIAQLWSWTNPDNITPIRAPEVVYLDGPYGSYQNGTAFSTVAAAGSRITQIDVSAGVLIDAIEVSIDGVSTGRHGGTGGAPSYSIHLEPAEFVTVANGQATGLINQLGFTVSNGATFQAGSDAHAPFSSKSPDGTTECLLVGLSGLSLNGTTTNSQSCNVKVLTFHWHCRLPLPG